MSLHIDHPALSDRRSPNLRMTEDEFVAWCDEDSRAEWVDGEVIVPSPANIGHVRLNTFLISVLNCFVNRRGLGEVFGPEYQVRLGKQRRRRTPDVLIVSKGHESILRRTTSRARRTSSSRSSRPTANREIGARSITSTSAPACANTG